MALSALLPAHGNFAAAPLAYQEDEPAHLSAPRPAVMVYQPGATLAFARPRRFADMPQGHCSAAEAVAAVHAG